MTNKKNVVIITSISSERLRYTLDIIFRNRLKVNYFITDNVKEVCKDDIVIEYNFIQKYEYDFIQASAFISRNSIDTDFYPVVKGKGEDLVIFPTENTLFKLDIFSAIFYCLSHYDAYLQTDKDAHGRIKFDQWFPRTSGLDQFPYVDIWIEKLKNYLESNNLECSESNFEQDISFDIDHLYLIDQRPLFQHIKASIGDLLKFNFFHLFKRWLIILGLTEDPAEKFFDMLDYQSDHKFTFFILMKQGKHNSLNPLNELKKLLIKKLMQYGQVEIHPSYQSLTKPELILQEKLQLSKITKTDISASRFHFLRLSFPESFVALNQYDIKTDQSVGYYDQPGFPSATCKPYHFFDLVNNQALTLIIQPFVWMDSMNKYYRKITLEEEKEELYHFKELCKKYNGRFSVVFHNDSMTERRYRMLFKSLLYS
ncbi:MAG TPA: hypothetical protein VLZ75_14800 [Chitinophagales bacterium]|nr:hypothetical protein [Chitinophagales bacterium]